MDVQDELNLTDGFLQSLRDGQGVQTIPGEGEHLFVVGLGGEGFVGLRGTGFSPLDVLKGIEGLLSLLDPLVQFSEKLLDEHLTFLEVRFKFPADTPGILDDLLKALEEAFAARGGHLLASAQEEKEEQGHQDHEVEDDLDGSDETRMGAKPGHEEFGEQCPVSL